MNANHPSSLVVALQLLEAARAADQSRLLQLAAELAPFLEEEQRPAAASVEVESAAVDSPWLAPRRAAAYTNLSVAQLRRFVGNRTLVQYRVGGKVLFHRNDLDALVQVQPRSPQLGRSIRQDPPRLPPGRVIEVHSQEGRSAAD